MEGHAEGILLLRKNTLFLFYRRSRRHVTRSCADDGDGSSCRCSWSRLLRLQPAEEKYWEEKSCEKSSVPVILPLPACNVSVWNLDCTHVKIKKCDKMFVQHICFPSSVERKAARFIALFFIFENAPR